MEHFKGIRKVYMVEVVEGRGTPESVSRIVRYFFDLEQHGGSHGGLIGKLDPLEDTRSTADSNNNGEKMA